MSTIRWSQKEEAVGVHYYTVSRASTFTENIGWIPGCGEKRKGRIVAQWVCPSIISVAVANILVRST